MNHVERHVLACGYTVDRVEHDYGYDLVMHTYNDAGEIDSGFIFFQVKATDALSVPTERGTIAFSLDVRDLALWLHEFGTNYTRCV